MKLTEKVSHVYDHFYKYQEITDILQGYAKEHPELAHLTVAGTTPQAISYYERGERELKASAVVKIAEALHVSCDWLLTGRGTDGAPAAFAGLSPEKRKIAEDILNLCAQLGR